MKQLFARLNAVAPLSDGLIEFLREHLQSRAIKKGELLVKEGQVCRHIYFIEKGIVRQFVSAKSEDVTTWLLKEGDICISIKSFFYQIPASDSVQALENTIVWYLSHEKLEEGCRLYPEFATIRDMIKSHYYVKKEEREQSFRSMSNEEKYQYILANEPELIQRVHLTILCSYLLMSYDTLLDVRKKLRG